MSDRVARLFARKKIELSELQYLYHTAQQTVLCMTDGRSIATAIPLKEIFNSLPEHDFWNIQKGIAVAARYVLTVDDDGVYTMVDGKQFRGRQRNPAEHRRRRRALEHAERFSKNKLPQTLLEKCSLMEDAPIAFCVIELVFAEDGSGVDFIFRYCNKEMEVVEGVPVSQMIDRSFYTVFPGGDRKWIIPYADVALNGNRRVIRDFSPEIGKNLIIRCFQPQVGYCACLLVVDESPDLTTFQKGAASAG